jgi:hypothetical protein
MLSLIGAISEVERMWLPERMGDRRSAGG